MGSRVNKVRILAKNFDFMGIYRGTEEYKRVTAAGAAGVIQHLKSRRFEPEHITFQVGNRHGWVTYPIEMRTSKAMVESIDSALDMHTALYDEGERVD